MNVLLFVFSILLVAVSALYNFCGVVLWGTKARPYLPVRRLLTIGWFWCKWPSLAAVIINPWLTHVLYNDPFDVIKCLFFVYSLGIWWLLRNAGDNDEHRKQKRKLKEKVKAVGGRLVVVPETA